MGVRLYSYQTHNYSSPKTSTTTSEKTRIGVKATRIVKKAVDLNILTLCTKMREANIREDGVIRRMADFLRKVLPDYTAEN
jgi:hypothetical protein